MPSYFEAARGAYVVRDHLPEGARAVEVVVECGPLSGVVPEALEYCFDAIAAREGLDLGIKGW